MDRCTNPRCDSFSCAKHDDPQKDGIDVAIMAFAGAKLAGESDEIAKRNAEAILDLFGIKRKVEQHVER